VLVDGVPVNQPGGALDFANLTTDNIERIEIVRGPASVLYGSDAVTGVVQIFTRRGGETGETGRADVSVRGGTYGTVSWDASARGGGQGGSCSLSLSRFSRDGIYAFNNQNRNTVFSGLARLAPDDRTDATFSLRYDDNTYHFPTDGAGRAVDHNQFSYASGPTIGIDVGRQVTPRLEMRLLLALNQTDGGFDNRPDSAGDSLGFYFQTLDHIRRASADVRANLRVGRATVLTGGTAFELESERSFDNAGGQVDVRRRNAAYYAQAVTDLDQRVDLTFGARLEDNERFGTYTTLRLGAAYHLAGGARLRVTAGNGFREPSFFENYASGFAVGNPDLKPEHSRSWEVGLEQSFAAGRVTASAAFFDQRFRDMIDYNPSVPAGSANYYNVAAATANGVEVGLRAAAVGPVTVAASYTYLHTDVTNPGFDPSSGALLAAGQPLTRRPEHAARLDSGYRLSDRGTVSLAVTYVGDRVDQDFSTFPFPRVTLPSYARVDVAAQFELLPPRRGAPGVAISGRVENALDHSYQEVKNFPARRRAVFVGGELRFGGR
jgi:vitamin B12 transporter